MLKSSSPSTPDESAASPDEGGTSRRAPAREPVESIGFGHLPKRDFFALSLDTTLLSVEFPDETEERGKESAEDGNDAAAPNDIPSPADKPDDRADPALKETPAPDAVSPPTAEAGDAPVLIQERAAPPDKPVGPDMAATLNELEKIMAEWAPVSHASSPAQEKPPAAPPTEEAPRAVLPDVPISTPPAPVPPTLRRQSNAVFPLKITDDTLLPLPDIDIAPFIPDQPVVPPSTVIENIPTDARRGAAPRKTPYPPPAAPRVDRTHSGPARPAGSPASSLPRSIPARTAPLEPARPGRIAPGRSARPGSPEANALHTLAELRRLLSALDTPGSQKDAPQAVNPAGNHARARPTALRRPSASPTPPATHEASVSARPAPPPVKHFARLAGIPLVDPDPPAPAPRAVSRDLPVPPVPPSMPVKDAALPDDMRTEIPRPGVPAAFRAAGAEPLRVPSWPTRLAARLKRLLRRSPLSAESISTAETPAPAPSDVSSVSEPPRPEMRQTPASPDQIATASVSETESSRPASIPQPPSDAEDVPGQAPSSVPDAMSVPAQPEIGASSGLAPKASWPARLLARLKRGLVAASPPVSAAPSAADSAANAASEPSGLLQRLRNMEDEHRARLLQLTDRPRGPVYPSWEARRHLLDISLVDKDPTPGTEKKWESADTLHVLSDDAGSASTPDGWKTLIGAALLTAVVGALLYIAVNPAYLDLGLDVLRGLRH